MDSVPGQKGKDDPLFDAVVHGADRVLGALPFDAKVALNILALAAAIQIKGMARGAEHEAALLDAFRDGVGKNLAHCLRAMSTH